MWRGGECAGCAGWLRNGGGEEGCGQENGGGLSTGRGLVVCSVSLVTAYVFLSENERAEVKQTGY